VSQTIDEILERIRLEVRCRNLKLAPDLDETNGAVTPAAFPASESLVRDIRLLVDTGRLSHVTGHSCARERTGARPWCVYAIPLEDGRMLSKSRDHYHLSVAERSFPPCDREEICIKPML
jgi:hypothetical protein